MADTTALKNRIRAAIKANDNQEITGPVLQQSLLDIVDELDLYPELENEAQQRQSGDSTLQQAITQLQQANVKTPDCFSFTRDGSVPFIKIENSDNLTRGKYKISIFNNSWSVTSTRASNTTISFYSKDFEIKSDGNWVFIFYDFVNSEFYFVAYTAFRQSSIRHNTDLFILAADYRGTVAPYEDTDIIAFHYVNAAIVGYLGENYYTFNSPFNKWVKVDNLESVISHCKYLDPVPTENSENGIKSGAVYDAVKYMKTINSLLAPYTKSPFIKIENSDDLTRGKYKISIFAGGWSATMSGSSQTIISAYSKEIAGGVSGGVSGGWWMVFYDPVNSEFYKISYRDINQGTIRHSVDIFIMAVESDPGVEVGEITSFSYINSPLVEFLGENYYTFDSHRENWIRKDDLGKPSRLINTLLSPFSKTSFVKIENSDDLTKGKYKISIFNNAWFVTLNGSRNTTASFYSKDFVYSNNWIQIFYDVKQNEFYTVVYQDFKNSDIRNSTDLFILSCNYTDYDIQDFTYVNAPVVNYLGEDYYTFNSNFSHWVKVSDIVTPNERQSDMYIFQIGDSITWQKDNKLNDDPVTNPNTYKGHGFMRYVCEQMNIPANHHFPRGFNGQTVCGYANYLNSNPDAFPKSTTNMSNVIWVVELGTNDWGNSFNEPLGTKADYLNKTGNSTMYGALRTLVDYMVDDIDNNNVIRTRPQVVMLTPMDRGAYSNSTEVSWRPCSFQYDANGDLKFTPNNTGATINDYADAIRWVCEREGFVCVDFIENPICPRKYMNLALTFESCVMLPNDDKKPQVYQDIYVDNLHPTDKGDIIMGRLIYQKIMQFFYDSNI